MGKVFDAIEADLQAWMALQRVFFVASAPLSPDAHINCSPKGSDTFRVIGPQEVAYLDLTGSGVETIAHVQENGRIVILFCAFDGAPQIVRLHGKAVVLYPGDAEFERLSPRFPTHVGARAIVKVSVARISTSCGYSVPRLDFVEQRDVLDQWTARKSAEELAAYRTAKNATSIDGLPGHNPP
ncbi:MAG: pyridoxamine 5'-phosphate oxidase family protein [Verrucomicrobiae bacterium]|nr:pyridoxamine 5'-phosphate oxidase family protein [Verrucomicrobiae bacterium]